MLLSASSMSTPATSNLIWAKDTELVGLQLEVEPLQPGMLYQRYLVGLHAWFLSQVEALNPTLSAYLHDGGAEKPFALSNLEGFLTPIQDQFQVQSGHTYDWCIYAFSQPVVQWLTNWLTQLPSSLEIRDAAFQIKRVTLSQPPTTYKKLLRSQAATSAIVQLNFLSPTTFRSKGSSLPFPVPRNVFQSYLRRWNDFSAMPYEVDPFLDWIEANIHVHDYQLTARKVAVAKQGFITGFTGRLSYELKRTAFEEPDAIRLLHALLKFAAYCGTGYKTTFGLGRTIVEFSAPNLLSTPAPQPESSPAQSPQPEPALANSVVSMQKIDALTQQFIARRKRQGGTRSLTAARTEAEIIIRHEAGESLIAIAQKMGKSYEAVKKAYTRAKQALPGQSDLNLKE